MAAMCESEWFPLPAISRRAAVDWGPLGFL
jgi:hypothetical protein